MNKDRSDKWISLKDKYSHTLHNGTAPSTHKNAKKLRIEATEAEKKLWSFLRNRQLNGKKFRRQHPFSNYVLDFYCNECKLAVELDGDPHKQPDNKEHDLKRTAFLSDNGIRVLRFWNREVLKNIDKVIASIRIHLAD